MPSPGHTTLTRQSASSWAVDSFFDITYRIDFIGAPAGHLGGMSGSTTATIRMASAAPSPIPVSISCPADITTTAIAAAGAVVTYPAPTVTGGCSAPTFADRKSVV